METSQQTDVLLARDYDMDLEREIYDVRHRVERLEDGELRLEKKFDSEHSLLKDAVKDLSKSHQALADSFIRFEASVTTLSNFIKWQIPVFVTVVGMVIALASFVLRLLP